MRSRLLRTLCGLTAALLVACSPAQEPVQIGEANGAAFRLRIPRTWNQSLVIAAPGYSPAPVRFAADESAGAFATAVLRQGFAYAETGYSVGGIALAEAVADVRALRDHFVRTRGAPRHTFVVGESKGGLVALALVEASPGDYDGGVAISGLLSSPYAFFNRAFDLLVSYQKSFPGVLPPPDRIPPAYAATPQAVTAVLRALEGDAAVAAAVRRHAGVRNDEELAELLVFHSQALGELRRRCEGNAFVGGDANAAACVRRMVAPTGLLEKPFIAVDVTYDPVIPRWTGDEYVALLAQTGRQQFFVRRIVPGDGHLNVSTRDRVQAFTDLVRWSIGGTRP